MPDEMTDAAPSMLSPEIRALLASANQVYAEARTNLDKAMGALAFTKHFIETRYQLGAADVVDTETGMITRSP